jgi:hypothetical protein
VVHVARGPNREGQFRRHDSERIDARTAGT